MNSWFFIFVSGDLGGSGDSSDAAEAHDLSEGLSLLGLIDPTLYYSEYKMYLNMKMFAHINGRLFRSLYGLCNINGLKPNHC